MSDVLRSVCVTFTDQGGPIINDALDLEWTHVGIKIDGVYYEATWPRVKRSEALPHNKKRDIVLWAPTDRVDTMKEYAESVIGTQYSAVGYFVPRLYGKTRGIYCSQYAEYMLRAGGFDIPKGSGRDPDILLKAVEKLL